jgi:hypothetical protein
MRLQPVVGTEIINDIRLGHTWHEYFALRDFILNAGTDAFIEVGLHEGGLAYLLLPLLEDIKYLGIEVDCNIIRKRVKLRFKSYMNSKLLCADCFSSSVALEISELKSKIIYCDGGNKVKELEHFKHLCNFGDIIMAHDFYDGKRKVVDVPSPNAEVTPKDVLHLDEDETFIRLPDDIFETTRIIGWQKI